MNILYMALVLLLLARPSFAGDLHGTISDKTGGVLKTATVRLLERRQRPGNERHGRTRTVSTVFPISPGIYRLAVTCPGFSDASRTIVIEDTTATTTADFVLEIGAAQGRRERHGDARRARRGQSCRCAPTR